MINKTIYLSAGHSNKDSGAVYKDLKEAELTIKLRDLICKKFTDEYKEIYENDFKLYFVPDDLDLANSVLWVNDRTKKLDDGLALELHFNTPNDPNAKGAEIFYFTGDDKISKVLAEKFLTEYCKITNLKNRGAKPDNQSAPKRLGWIQDTKCWALLLECGFLCGDYNYIKTNLEQIADGVIAGVLAVLEIKQPEKYKAIIETQKIELKKIINNLKEASGLINEQIARLSIL